MVQLLFKSFRAFDYDRAYHDFNIQDTYIFVFVLDFFLNFLKVPSLDVRDHDIFRVFMHYLK